MILSTHLLALLAIYSPIIVEASLHLRSQTIDLDPPKLSHDATSRALGKENNHENIEVCHLEGNGGWHTIKISANAWKAHEKHGDLINACEHPDNMRTLCSDEEDGCTDMIQGDTEAIVDYRNEHEIQEPIAVQAVGGSEKLQVLSCEDDWVKVKGTSTAKLQSGDLLLYDDDAGDCGDCHPLYRSITSIEDGPEANTKILFTTPLKMKDVYDEGIYGDYPDVEVETFLCPEGGDSRSLVSFPSSCIKWHDKSSSGDCVYTDCFVGHSKASCFNCENGCNNGCGSYSYSFSGNFLLWNFGPYCCIHDYCYSSDYSKAVCDTKFRAQMRASCPIVTIKIPIFFWGFLVSYAVKKAVSTTCLTAADGFYLAVALAGNNAYNNAQDAQETYEKSKKCQTCSEYLLSKTNEELFDVSVNTESQAEIGKYCYIADASSNPASACSFYAKGRRSTDGANGVPPETLEGQGGTGCIYGGRNDFKCYMRDHLHLSTEEMDDMCTVRGGVPDYKNNGGAQIRWAITNGWCMDAGNVISVC